MHKMEERDRAGMRGRKRSGIAVTVVVAGIGGVECVAGAADGTIAIIAH